eukprot:scaffold27439_cov34-Tisochrysis_lutea.AAC.2
MRDVALDTADQQQQWLRYDDTDCGALRHCHIHEVERNCCSASMHLSAQGTCGVGSRGASSRCGRPHAGRMPALRHGWLPRCPAKHPRIHHSKGTMQAYFRMREQVGAHSGGMGDCVARHCSERALSQFSASNARSPS